jgi:hypothetical protein
MKDQLKCDQIFLAKTDLMVLLNLCTINTKIAIDNIFITFNDQNMCLNSKHIVVN